MIDSSKSIAQKRPHCPSCGRVCEPGTTWKGSNYCRGLVLLRFIEDQPGLSGWELAQISGVPYTDATRGLAKLREHGVVRTESEERDQGGIRYRYRPDGGAPARARFMEALRRAEALND
jgi:hypothetical protein